MPFADRADAGRQLAGRLEHLRGGPLVVLGLPRGGVPVAFQVALRLDAPLDVLVVRKLGVPFQPELAMGALGEDGVRVIDQRIMDHAGVAPDDLLRVEERERAELDRRVTRYRGTRQRIPLDDRTAVIVDDGLATGSTARAACRVARLHGASRVVLAVPVAPRNWSERIGDDADECVCVESPATFFAIGQFYEDFSQTTDEEVASYLERADRRESGCPAEAGSSTPGIDVREADVEMSDGPDLLNGHVSIPENPSGLVIFAHGSGSGRNSPRNRYVARILNTSGIATVLFDLLSPGEELNRSNVFDIELLATRLSRVTAWAIAQPELMNLPIGYFGASTGAAAALAAASEPVTRIGAVVSRGGRPDLAWERLADVDAPTLLIVGGNDAVVLDLNRKAYDQLRCERRLAVAEGATHLFEEPGTLEHVATLACDWFAHHLSPVALPAP